MTNIFPNITSSATCLLYYYGSLVIQLSHDQISLVYSFSGLNYSFMNGVGVPSVNCQISISAGIGQYYLLYCSIFCAQLTPIVSQFEKFALALTLITMIIITCSGMPRLSLVDKARVVWANTCRVYEKVDGRVCVWSRPGEGFAWPACSPGLNPIGQLWDLGRAVRTRVTIATMHDLRQIVVNGWNAIPHQRPQRLISSMRRRYEAVAAAFGGSTHYQCCKCLEWSLMWWNLPCF